MDAMPVKELIASELVNEEGQCCTIGVVCKARGLDVSKVDPEEPEQVGEAVGIARQMAAEIEYWNDEVGEEFVKVPEERPSDEPWHPGFRWERVQEPAAKRWQRMRAWVDQHLRKEQGSANQTSRSDADH